MLDTVFVLNLAAGVLLGLMLWRLEKVRAMVVFHIGGAAVAGVLFAMLFYLAASVEAGEDKVWAVLRVVAAAVLYAPFGVFLVFTYVRALGGMADGGLLTTEMKLEDAAQALRLGQHSQAEKIIRGVLGKDPDNIDARTTLAQVQLSRGQYQKAVGSFRLAMAGARDDAEFAQFVFTVAVILHEHLGQGQAAARELDLIRKRLPGTPQAEKAQRWIVRIMDEVARKG